jgi:hypothetical protein
MKPTKSVAKGRGRRKGGQERVKSFKYLEI